MPRRGDHRPTSPAICRAPRPGTSLSGAAESAANLVGKPACAPMWGEGEVGHTPHKEETYPRRAPRLHESASHDPGAAVPVGLDSAGKEAEVEMELIRKRAKARVEIELELLGGLDPDELSASRGLVRSGERGHGATTATPLRPHVDAAAALLDQIGRGIRDDDAHQREMIAEARPLLLCEATHSRWKCGQSCSRIQLALRACISSAKRQFRSSTPERNSELKEDWK
jgi:hypothetical protein